MRGSGVLLWVGVAAWGTLSGAAWGQLAGRGVARFEVAPSQAGPWAGGLSVAPGAPVFVRLVCAWESGASVPGFAGAMFEDIRFVGADGTDGMAVSEDPNWSPTPDVTGPFTLWKRQASRSSWAVYDTPTGRALDEAVNPESGRVAVGQTLAPGLFDPSNPLVSVLFRFTAGQAAGGARSIAIGAALFRSTTPAPAGGHFLVYADGAGTPSKLAGGAAVESAMVTIVPAPGGLAWLGLMLLGRRRR